jgi:hypothetical protein
MAREPDKRVETWDKKFNTTRVKQSLDAMRPDMLAHYAAAVAKLCEMELAVKEVLNQSGIHTTLYVSYLNFGRQLYKLTRQRGISGSSFALAAQVLLEKWSGRGCDPAILATIRTQVFNVPPPTHQ